MSIKKTDEILSNKNVDNTLANKIWEEIKNLKIDMFALPNQRVHNYCKPISVDPDKLFLIPTAWAVLPVLEQLLNPKYIVDKQDRFLIISPANK